MSAYEMSYKHHRGRWPEVQPLVGAFEEVVAAEGFDLLPLAARHAIRAGSKDKWLMGMGAEVVWGRGEPIFYRSVTVGRSCERR